MTKRRILGAVLTVWGAAVLLNALITGLHAHGAYGGGEVAALIFALGFISFGVRAMKRDTHKMLSPMPRREEPRAHDEPSA